MRKAILTLLLVMVTAPAWAEWVKMGESNASVLYIDPATISKDGHLRKVWEIRDLKQRNEIGAMSLRGLFEYDCKAGKSRNLSVSAHSEPMAAGKTLLSTSDPNNWNAVPSGTAVGSILKSVCAK
jgi:hypothetical protein